MRALPVSLVLLLLAAACSRAPAPTPAPDAGAAATPAAPAAASSAAPATPPTPAAAPASVAATRLRGTGIMGKDGYGITLCGEDRQRIAVLDAQAQALLDGYLAGGAREFLVDGWGDLVGADKVHLSSLERIGPVGEGQGCDERGGAFVFKAHGNEPFWSVELTDGKLVYTRPDAGTFEGTATELTQTHGIRSFSATTGAGRVTLRVSPASCNDGMADGLYAWRAEVTVGAEKLSGCAYAGSSGPR